MSAIGSIVNTPQGPSRVVSVLPGTVDVGSQTKRAAVTAPLAGGGAQAGQNQDLTLEESRRLRDQQATDRAVRAEEQRHKAVAGAYGTSIQYQYVRGEDGQYYAVGGSVTAKVAATAPPEEKDRAAGAMTAAALSVATPSSSDFTAAAQAAAYDSQGQARERERRGGTLDLAG
jgi:SprA-related family.